MSQSWNLKDKCHAAVFTDIKQDNIFKETQQEAIVPEEHLSWTWFECNKTISIVGVLPQNMLAFLFLLLNCTMFKVKIRVIKMLCDLIQKLLVLIRPVITITKRCHMTHVHGNRPGNCPCNHLLSAIMHSSDYTGSVVTLFKVSRSWFALT